ncbi:hypothetical protein SNE40_003158 [Patella caerulea]|uniref:Uncharacterized protein n=1 Tax=Patella caerulea TaxID=87958 RepID=A0AAN8QEV5_PATCE
MVLVVFLLCMVLRETISAERDVCVVNRSTETFDCQIYISNCTMSADKLGTIARKDDIKNCSIGPHIDGNINMTCPVNFQNNILPHNISFTSGNCTKNLHGITVFKWMKPNPIGHVELSYGTRRISIQGSMKDELIPSTASREVNIVVEQQITDEDLITRQPIRNKTETTYGIELNTNFYKLHANIDYSVKIIWRVEGSIFWSEPIVHYIKTAQWLPTAAPELLKGAYSVEANDKPQEQTSNQQDNRIALYWQKIPKLRENGPGLEYVIYRIRTDNKELINVILDNNSFQKLSRLNISLEETNKDNETTSLLVYQTAFNSSKISGILRNFQEGDIVMILANNTVGLSNFYSAQRILSTAEAPIQPSTLKVEFINGTHSNLTWKLPHLLSIDHLHFYWCYGIWWKLEGWVECKNQIWNKTVAGQSTPPNLLISSSPSSSSSSYNSHVIDITQEENITCEGCFLHFGISTENKNISSPIIWNTSLSVLQPPSGSSQSDSGVLGALEISLIIGCVAAVIIIVLIVIGVKKYFTRSYDIKIPKDLNVSVRQGIDNVAADLSTESEESNPDSGKGGSVSENDTPIHEYSKLSVAGLIHDKSPNNITKQKCEKSFEDPLSLVQTDSSGLSSQNDKRLSDDSCGEYFVAAMQGQPDHIEMTEISLDKKQMSQESGEKTNRLPSVHHNGNISASQSDDDDDDDRVPHIEVNTSFEEQYNTGYFY